MTSTVPRYTTFYKNDHNIIKKIDDDDDHFWTSSCAHLSHGIRAATSSDSTVAPHQIRRPSGVSRYAPVILRRDMATSQSAGKHFQDWFSTPRLN